MEFISSLAMEMNIPFSYGGGIQNLNDAKNILFSGADKIILNSAIFENPDLINEISDYIGAQSVIVSVDVKKIDKDYFCFSHSGTKNRKINILDYLKYISNQEYGELILCSIDKEGTMQGYDLELIEIVSQFINVPLIASGGAGSYEDMLDALKAGASAIAAGSIFHFTEMNPSGAKKYLHKKGIKIRDGFKYI